MKTHTFAKTISNAIPLALLILCANPTLSSAFTLNEADVKGWSSNDLSVDYNFDNCGSISADAMKNIAQNAFDLWNSAPNSRLTIKLGAAVTTTGAQARALSFTASSLVLVCDPSFSTTTSSQSGNGTLGVGSAGAKDGSGYYTKGFLILNTQSGNTPNVTTISTAQAEITIAHELGHSLGFGHSSDSTALMHYTTGSKASLSFSQDDIDGITYLYGRSEPKQSIMGCGTLQYPAGPGNGPMNGPFWLFLVWFLIIPAILTKQHRKLLSRSFSRSY